MSGKNYLFLYFIVLFSLVICATGVVAQQYTLTIEKVGTGSGIVTSTPAGINCGSDCSETVPQGKKIKLKAKASSGSIFGGWGGACTGTTLSCTVTINGDQVVTATFVLPDLRGELSDVSIKKNKSNYDVSGKLTLYADEGKALGVTARIYLSDDKEYDENDRLLGSVTFGTINAGSSKSKSFKYSFKTTPSEEYLIALIDPDDKVPESDEGNNEEEVEIPSEDGDGEAMKITSAAFTDQGRIPMKYVMPGAGGQNVSIPIGWNNPPSDTKSFALSIVDTHPVADNWVHWLVINIPKETTSIAEGASGMNMPLGAVELQNSFGFIGYGGPQPPIGSGDHSYVVTIYALNVETFTLGVNTSLSAFNRAIAGKVIKSATITGMFGR